MRNLEKIFTERMAGERVRESDFDDLFRMNQDPEVAKTMAGTRSDPETREFIRRNIAHWERNGHGLWIFRLREDARFFVGRAALNHVIIEDTGEIELGYAVMPEFWRQGFASEMARALIAVATELRIPSIVAFTLPTNIGSRRVMERAGFEYECDITWAGLPHVLYRKTLR